MERGLSATEGSVKESNPNNSYFLRYSKPASFFYFTTKGLKALMALAKELSEAIKKNFLSLNLFFAGKAAIF